MTDTVKIKAIYLNDCYIGRLGVPISELPLQFEEVEMAEDGTMDLFYDVGINIKGTYIQL